jgi:hypothetical protein
MYYYYYYYYYYYIIININTNIANMHNVQYCSVASQSVTWSPMEKHLLIPTTMFTKRSKHWSLSTCENRTRCSLWIVCLAVAAHMNCHHKLIVTNNELRENNGFSFTRIVDQLLL